MKQTPEKHPLGYSALGDAAGNETIAEADAPKTSTPAGDALAHDPNGIQLTDAAIAHVCKKLNARGHGQGMRIRAVKAGCNGFKYEVSFVDTAEASDHSFTINDQYQLFVDPDSFAKLKGLIVDFVREGINEQFKYINPNQKGVCGCGESFNVEE